jgi:hypothetical protein
VDKGETRGRTTRAIDSPREHHQHVCALNHIASWKSRENPSKDTPRLIPLSINREAVNFWNKRKRTQHSYFRKFEIGRGPA